MVVEIPLSRHWARRIDCFSASSTHLGLPLSARLSWLLPDASVAALTDALPAYYKLRVYFCEESLGTTLSAAPCVDVVCCHSFLVSHGTLLPCGVLSLRSSELKFFSEVPISSALEALVSDISSNLTVFSVLEWFV